MIDWNLFSAYLGNLDKDQVSDIIGTFVESYPAQLGMLKAAVAGKNLARVGDIAHDLKANTATFGATVASDLAFRLEMIGKSLEEDRMDEIFPAFEAAMEPVIRELKAYLVKQPA